MDLFDLSAKISLDTSGYDKGINEAESKIGGFGDKLKNGLGVAGAVAGAAVTAAAAGISTIVGKSISEYGQYEQLVGGMETLFKNAAPKIIQNADNAYKTAGMSANDYMTNVTQFAATLINSLDGDTEQAVDYADKAIRQMSDNVNKMGTSTEMVQNAYRGFARGNFTMLDNLSIGFAGSKEGMQKLLDKAKELSEQQGEYRDFSIESYADIVDAIGLVQDEMGITGTTAKEASGTITGSLSSVQGAWDNLLVALASGEGVDEKVDVLMDSIGAAADNLIPRFETALEAIPGLISAVVPKIIEELPRLASEVIPKAVSAVGDIIQAVITNLPALVQSVTDALNKVDLPKLIGDLVATLTSEEYLNKIMDAGLELLGALLNNVEGIIEALAGNLGTFITNLVNSILTHIPDIVNMGVDLLCHLIDDVDLIIDGITDGIWGIIDGIFDLLTDPKAQAKLMLAGLKLGVKLIEGFLKTATGLSVLEKIPVIGELFKGFSGAISSASDSIIGNIDNMIAALDADVKKAANTSSYSTSVSTGLSSDSAMDEKFGRTTSVENSYGSGGRGFDVNVNIIGDVKAEDVADEIENRLAGKMSAQGVSVR